MATQVDWISRRFYPPPSFCPILPYSALSTNSFTAALLFAARSQLPLHHAFPRPRPARHALEHEFSHPSAGAVQLLLNKTQRQCLRIHFKQPRANMALEDAHAPTGTTPKALPAFDHHSMTPHPPKSPRFPNTNTTTSTSPTTIPSSNHARSTPNPSRRHSLPLHFLPPALWSANTSTASLVVESEEAARGEHILDEATVAHRISALRQLNGATRSGHRYAKSTGARNSTFSQPVIVRTYSGARPQSQQRDIITPRRENGHSMMTTPKMDLKLPPIEAFTFKGIMDEIRHGVSDDLERIAEICARSKYSLSNQYEVHMPPHGGGEAFLPTTAIGPASNTNVGPTLQAVGSDDEHTRSVGRGSRGGRRTKSVAYGTLETIMSSSRSSDEDNTKKKAAAVIAEEVRGRAAKKELLTEILQQAAPDLSVEAGPSTQTPPKHTRSKSATFASVIIDNTLTPKNKDENAIPLASPTSLISEPARPQTSTATDLRSVPAFGEPGTTMHKLMSMKPATIKNESRAATLRREAGSRPSILGSLSSWLPWSKPDFQGRQRSASHAEGSLRDLLKSTEGDRKGKGVDRSR